jgi:trk system potassium uptake protein TrkA
VAKHKFHVDRTIARVNNPKNEHLFRMLGIDVTVSQTNHILHLIEQSIPHHSFVHLMSLRHPDFEIVDAKLADDSRSAHAKIGEIQMPPNCIIAAISRGPELIIPNPTTELLPGDDVIAIAHRDYEDELRAVLVD